MGTKEKEFNTILDECLDRILFMGETPEQCLASYPQYADELKSLLEAAVMTSQVNQLEPDADFKRKARGEFLSVVREAEPRKKPSFFSIEWLSLRRGLVTGVAAVLIVLIALGGTAAASLNSMPNNFLYPVKRATEQVQLAFTFTSIGKAEAYARLANTRVNEIVYMAGLNDGNKIEMLASSMNSDLMNVAAVSGRNTSTGSGVTSEQPAQAFMMSAASDQSAPATKSASNAGAATGGAVAESAPVIMQALTAGEGNATSNETNTGITGAAAPEATPAAATAALPLRTSENETETGPMSALNSSIIDQANTNINILNELLNTVPDSLKPLIQKAIELSRQGYDIAINATQP